MKQIGIIVLLFISILAYSQTEHIRNMDVVIEVDTLSDLTVKETIEVYANRNQIKRGIYRALPLNRTTENGGTVPIAYTILSIKLNDKVTKYHTEEKSGFFNIYIGDKNIILTPGFYRYDITYKTYGQIGFEKSFNEIYWNVNGTNWTIPAESVTATVILPDGTDVLEVNCYTGRHNSNDRNCEGFTQPDVHFAAKNLSIKENLTISVAFEKGTIVEPPPPSIFERFRLLFLGLLIGLSLLIYYVSSWMKHGRDPVKPAVYPIYEPPEDLSPAGLSSIYKDSIQNNMLSVSLINLAVKGYITIEEITQSGMSSIFNSSTYTLTRIKQADSTLPKEEKVLLDSMFTSSNTIALDNKYNTKVSTASIRYQHELKDKYQDIIEKGRNTKFLVLPILGVLAFIIISLMLGDLVIPDSVVHFFTGGLAFLVFSSFFVFPLLMHLFKKSNKIVIMIIPILISVALILIMWKMPTANLNSYVILGFIAFAIISIVIYKYLIERPSEEKLALQSKIEGFRMYMEAAEDNQIQNFNPPSMTPDIFERYLPYAIALGVDKVWGDKFQSYLVKAALTDQYQSGWYIGNHHFSPNLYRTVNSSVNSSVNATATPPSQSGGGSYSSGSGGGGFSGGGGGGGGGGGW